MINISKQRCIIAIQAPKPQKPSSREQLGYFLAGLIDSDGHISKPGYVQIDFHVQDIGIAYYVKYVIGYGTVSQEKKRLSVRYRCTQNLGLVYIADLIRHKLKHTNKIEQFNTRLVPRLKAKAVPCDATIYTTSNILHNHWLAGFIQGDGSVIINHFKAKGYNYKKTTLILTISQKKRDLLDLIVTHFGGHVHYRKSQDTFTYINNSFLSASKFIDYLDKFQLMGSKLKQYAIWRNAYLIVQDGAHRTATGEMKLAELKIKLTELKQFNINTLREMDLAYRVKAKQKRKFLREKTNYFMRDDSS